MKTVLVSAVALMDADGRVLLGQRPEGKSMAGLWEFPGGKIEADELPVVALAREMREELGITICEPCSTPLTFVSHRYEDFHLLMLLYVCRKWEGIPTPLEGQNLTWKYPHEMAALPMPPADLPLVAALRDSIHTHR
jgi:8-oxo-dGTP diphosphatase